jgi:hypothetical protein
MFLNTEEEHRDRSEWMLMLVSMSIENCFNYGEKKKNIIPSINIFHFNFFICFYWSHKIFLVNGPTHSTGPILYHCLQS